MRLTHIFLGLLSYWIVNIYATNSNKSEKHAFGRILSEGCQRQKAVTTEATNALGEKVHMRLCSKPNKSADDIYERLKYKKMPFRKIRIEKSFSTQYRK